MKQIMLTTKDKHPYRFEETDDVVEWLEDRQRMLKAVGFKTEITDRNMLFVYDQSDNLKCIYSEYTEEELIVKDEYL